MSCNNCPPETPPVTIDPPPECVGEACVEIWSTDCISYDGTALPDLDIETEDRVTAVIENIAAAITVFDVTNTMDLPAGDGILNTKSGLITYDPAGTIASGDSVTFTITNSLVTTSNIVLAVVSSNATTETVVIKRITPSNGSFVVELTNVSAGGWTDSIQLRFMIF